MDLELTIHAVVIIEEDIEIIWEEKHVLVVGAEVIFLGIGETLLEPVVPEPRRRLDERPPLLGEVLHSPVRRRHERRCIRVQA